MPIGNYIGGIGGWTGRIGALGLYNIVGANPLMPQMPGLPMGGGLPGLPQGMHPAMLPGVVPGHMPFGQPPAGPMALTGPVPGMAWQQAPQQDAYALVLPLPSTGALAAAASATVTVAPQRPMRIERFTTTATAGVFTIANFFAGVDNQFIAAGAVDAAIFAQTAFGVGLRGSTVYPGITISMLITNISAAAATAQGWAFIGTAVA